MTEINISRCSLIKRFQRTLFHLLAQEFRIFERVCFSMPHPQGWGSGKSVRKLIQNYSMLALSSIISKILNFLIYRYLKMNPKVPYWHCVIFVCVYILFLYVTEPDTCPELYLSKVPKNIHCMTLVFFRCSLIYNLLL